MIKSVTDTKTLVRNWWKQITHNNFERLSTVNRYNCRNLLAGFLQACEQLGHLTHDEASALFEELSR